MVDVAETGVLRGACLRMAVGGVGAGIRIWTRRLLKGII